MKLPLRQDKSRKGGWECDLKPFVASRPAGSELCVSLLRSNADCTAGDRTSSRNSITVAASVRLCFAAANRSRHHGGQFRSYPLFATDGGLIAYRPPIMGEPRIELWRRNGRAGASIRTSIKHGLVGLVLI